MSSLSEGLDRFDFGVEKVYRAVCTGDKNGGSKINVDFADANPKTAKLTHMHLLKLRQYLEPSMEMILPQLFVRENATGGVSVEFAKPNEGTEYNKIKLSGLMPRILCEFNKFRYRGNSTSFEHVIDEDTQRAAIYGESEAMKIAKTEIHNEQERSMVVSILTAKSKKDPDLLPYLHLARDGD